MATKDEILRAIKLHAAQNGGVGPGQSKFAEKTGITRSAWYGKFWARWSDAIQEANLTANVWGTQIFSDEDVVRHLADLTMQLGHYPGVGDRGMKRQQDPSFPNRSVFIERIGPRQSQLRALMEFGATHDDYRSVYEICAPLIKPEAEELDVAPATPSFPGHVYLIYSHSLQLYKIGESDDPPRRYREIQQSAPGAINEVHVLETDDPAGIERYWHRRFRAKKKINEWYDLSPSDVEAFKSRGTSM